MHLDEDTLAISTELRRTLPGQSMPEISYERYLIRLNSESELEEIEPPIEKKDNSLLFNVLEAGKIKQITIPNNGEKGFVAHNGVNYNFAFDLTG